MSLKYLIKRIIIFFLTIVIAATVNFIIPRITPQDPVAALLGKMASRGQMVADGEKLIMTYREEFGLNDSIPVQYAKYLKKILFSGDLGYSLSYFPANVSDVILRAIPWSLGLLSVANLIAFITGNLLGALCVWGKTPKLLKGLVYALMPFSVIPYYILALLMLYCFAIYIPIFPLGGTMTAGSVGGYTFAAFLDLARHAALPILSVAVSLIGFWALSMRGIMATVMGEDYLTYAHARGLKKSRIFSQYAMRNALLPQVTAFAIDIGRIISGAVLVEIIFNYPGIGTVLYNALRTADYFVIQGVVFFIIISVALTTLLIDLVYPKLDPRIKYK